MFNLHKVNYTYPSNEEGTTCRRTRYQTWVQNVFRRDDGLPLDI